MIDTSDRLWLLLDCTNPARGDVADLLNSRHKEFWENHNLSIVVSDDGTLCVIKVEGANVPAWKTKPSVAALLESGIVLASRGPAGHQDIKDLILTNAWRRQWDEEANWPPSTPLRDNIIAFRDNLWATT